MTRILVIAALGALAACAQVNHYRNVVHPEDGQVQFNADWYACERANSHPAYYNNGYVAQESTAVDNGMAWNCMAARGWQRVLQ